MDIEITDMDLESEEDFFAPILRDALSKSEIKALRSFAEKIIERGDLRPIQELTIGQFAVLIDNL
jgi:hypothetical protein